MQDKAALSMHSLPTSSFGGDSAPQQMQELQELQELQQLGHSVAVIQAKDVLTILLVWLLIYFQNLQMYVIS